jgi:hypothetical protein
VRVVLRFVRVFLPSPASVALVRLVYLTVLFYLTIDSTWVASAELPRVFIPRLCLPRVAVEAWASKPSFHC